MDEKRASTYVQADARRTNRAGPRDSPGKLLKAVTETISGPIRITGESVSDEQDAWAKAMLELILPNLPAHEETQVRELLEQCK